MASIILNAAAEKQLSLLNNEFIRKFSFGNDWLSLRVAFRSDIQDTGAPANGAFGMGVCSGTTDGYTSANTVDWCGTYRGTSWSRGPVYYSMPSGKAHRKVGASTTIVSPTNTYASYITTDTTGAGPTMFTISRNIDTATATVKDYVNFNQVVTTLYQTRLYAEGNNGSLSDMNQGYSATDIACGSFYDSLSVFWTDTTHQFFISELCIVRLA